MTRLEKIDAFYAVAFIGIMIYVFWFYVPMQSHSYYIQGTFDGKVGLIMNSPFIVKELCEDVAKEAQAEVDLNKLSIYMIPIEDRTDVMKEALKTDIKISCVSKKPIMES
jgi:hypothetical protein